MGYWVQELIRISDDIDILLMILSSRAIYINTSKVSTYSLVLLPLASENIN